MAREQSLRNAALRLNGHQFVDHPEGGEQIMFSEETLAEIRRTSSGSRIVSNRNVRGGTVRITVEPNSRSYQRLFSWQAQQKATGRLIVFNGSMTEENGSSYVLRNGTMMSAPMGSTYRDMSAQPATFSFDFETIVPEVGSGQYEAPGPQG